MNDKNSAVVTGIGLVTPLGVGREGTWKALLAGSSAVSPDRAFKGLMSARVAGIGEADEVRLLSMGFLASAEALSDGRFDPREAVPGRFGCTISVSKPNLWLKKDICGGFLPGYLNEKLRTMFGIDGPAISVSAACATGTNSIAVAAGWIENGLCDAVLAGAAEASLHPLYVAGFDRMGVLSRSLPAPFDKNRSGFAIGEGSAVLLIERKDKAVQRGAAIYGTVSGYALGSDNGGTVAFSENGESVSRIIKKALLKAGLDSVGYINAHGTGTRLNDMIEAKAIRSAFGADFARIPVSSTKAATGHMLGAAGATEAAFCLLAIRDNCLPCTLNHKTQEEGFGLDIIAGAARNSALNSAASLSLGFGGQTGVLVFSRG